MHLILPLESTGGSGSGTPTDIALASSAQNMGPVEHTTSTNLWWHDNTVVVVVVSVGVSEVVLAYT